MSHELMAPLMFGALVILLLLGYPVAFSLAANGLLFGWIGIEMGLLKPELLQAIPERIFGIINNDTLLAIPFFTFMGLILERSGMAEDLLDTVGELFGPVRGGLTYAVIIVGAMLAATTGVVAASVISMGLISLPIMMRYGYDNRLSAGVIAASGTLAQIIPPSLVLIVLADQMGISIGDMYRGAFVPGFVLTGLYAVFVFVVSMLAPKACPALPPTTRRIRERSGHNGLASLFALLVVSIMAGILFTEGYYTAESPMDEVIVISSLVGIGFAWSLAAINRLFKIDRHFGFGLFSRLTEKVVFVMIPPMALIFLVLGTIFLGIATPTEGGAMGAVGAIALALLKRRLNWKLTTQAMDSTAKLTTFVVFILIGARVFSLTFYAVDGDRWVEHLLSNLPGGQLGFLIVVNLMIFVIAFFLDFFEIAFIMIPLLTPVAQKLGIDLVWFGVMLGVNMQTSFMHPPFGFALFFLRSVAPAAIKTTQIYAGAIPFVAIQLVMVALIVAFPGLVTHFAHESAKEVVPAEIPLEQMPIPQYEPELNFDEPKRK